MDKLYPETPFADCSWYRSDIENALDLIGYPLTDHNIEAVLNHINEDDLLEAMIQAGWDYIYAKRDEAENAGDLEDSEKEEDIEPDDSNLEMGFDPYMGCYTDEC